MDKLKFAKNLRKTQTETEKRLWYLLRNRQLQGIKFRRQQPVGSYIVDFISYDQRLVIELDGSQHQSIVAVDASRTKFFKDQGYIVLRFWDNELFENQSGVLETILKHISPSSSPSPIEGEGTVIPI